MYARLAVLDEHVWGLVENMHACITPYCSEASGSTCARTAHAPAAATVAELEVNLTHFTKPPTLQGLAPNAPQVAIAANCCSARVGTVHLIRRVSLVNPIHAEHAASHQPTASCSQVIC